MGKLASQYPWRLFLITMSPPSSDCGTKRAILSEILSLDGPMLGNTVEHLRQRFLSAFADGANTGFLNEQIYDMLVTVGKQMRLHTQDVEGANNLLAEICKRCPWIGHDGLNNRFVIRRKVLNGGSTKMWSCLKPRIDEIREQCIK